MSLPSTPHILCRSVTSECWIAYANMESCINAILFVHLGGYSDSDASDNEIKSEGGDDSDLEERILTRRKAFRRWEETAMRELEEREQDQQRRMRRDESRDPSPAGGNVQESPKSGRSPLRSRRSVSKSADEADSESKSAHEEPRSERNEVSHRGESNITDIDKNDRDNDQPKDESRSREKSRKDKQNETSSSRKRSVEGNSYRS